MRGRRLLLLVTLCLAAVACRTSGPAPGVKIDLTDRSGLAPKALDRLEAGDSLTLGLNGLRPRSQVELYLNDDLGKEWSYARLFADDKGRVAPQLFWYQSGVIGTTSRKIDFKPDPAFLTFEEAENYFAQHPLTVVARDEEKRVLARQVVKIGRRTTPMIYPSNEKGILENSVNAATEDLYISGTNFPPGATVQLMAVDNRYVWNRGDTLVKRASRTIQLAPGQTRFTERILRSGEGRPGAYDLVARIGAQAGRNVLEAGDILSFNEDTGVILYMIVNGNIVIDSAGRLKNAPAKFEFSDAFEKGEDVWGAVDPSDVPAVHSGGNYAAYWVVNHQNNAYWDGVSPTLADVSGGTEIQRVKYWCINASRRMIWPAATQPEPIKAYDVIVDFGAVPSMTGADFVNDNVYDKGTDFVDGYNTDAGFYVGENPGATGSFLVGSVDLNDPAGISGITDPTGVTGPTYDVNLAWARIMYPATMSGVGTPISGALPSYPVALFLHGRHWNCDNDGSGSGLAGGYSYSCAAANRIPSHLGYDYIMERLASQGIFCISISAHDIQPDNGTWNYNARGRLVLKFLDKLKDWNDNGTDPFGGMFNGKIDLSRIALSGHSRGGEGVVAAAVLNLSWPTHYSILAVNAIAPTDQNAASDYVPTEPAYFLLLGARDGDVSNMQGVRTYDRAFPDGVIGRPAKVMAYVYNANHNYFNTIWTDTAALGTPNPWAGQTDDHSSGLPELTAADQRLVGLTTVAAFFRWKLLNQAAYREVLTGRIEPAGMQNQLVFWTFQDGNRKAADNFEQAGMVGTTNTLLGSNTAPGFGTFEERRLNHDSSSYSGSPLTDSNFYHDTIGLKLAWAAPQTYTVNIPAASRNFSAYTHLTFRVGQKATAAGTGPDINFNIQLEDGMGRTGLWPFRTDQYDRIPHAYEDPAATFPFLNVMTGVRIPLRAFTLNNSMVDLTDVARITIMTEGSGEIAIDDIEFGQ
jgi:hypothetical protein